MDLSSASQCSSGCESGWTLYLDQSSYSKNQYYNLGGIVSKGNNEVEEEEEDLSMVSDASSGPRHYHCEEEDEYCFGGGDHHGNANNCFGSNDSGSGLASKKSKSKMKNKEQQHGKSQVHHSYLDDTASSPVLGFSKVSLHNYFLGKQTKH